MVLGRRSPLVLTFAVAVVVAGLVHCGSDHPPLVDVATSNPPPAATTAPAPTTEPSCFDVVPEGGCNVLGGVVLPLGEPFTEAELATTTTGGGFCFSIPIGTGLCASSSQQTVTCIDAGVLEATSTPGCVFDAGPSDASSAAD